MSTVSIPDTSRCICYMYRSSNRLGYMKFVLNVNLIKLGFYSAHFDFDVFYPTARWMLPSCVTDGPITIRTGDTQGDSLTAVYAGT